LVVVIESSNVGEGRRADCDVRSVGDTSDVVDSRVGWWPESWRDVFVEVARGFRCDTGRGELGVLDE
jgi:hypothetical protein